VKCSTCPARAPGAPEGDNALAEKNELPLVMREIADAMRAHAAILTVHSDEGEAEILHGEELPGVETDRIRALFADGTFGDNRRRDLHAWIECDLGPDIRNVFLIPVDKIQGQNKLIIAAFFGPLDSEERRAAERVYLNRRPFAIGYFRLWQLDRVRSRRIDALETALDLNDMGVFLLDRAGDLLFANETGRNILDKGEGLRRHRKSFRATDLSDSLRLQVVLDHVMNFTTTPPPRRDRPQPTPLVALQRGDGAPLMLSVMPTNRAPTEPSDAAAIVFVLDPEIDIDGLIQPLCALYRLTAVESELLKLMVKGTTIAVASEILRLKEQTARGYLKQIFVKTGTNRQSELMRLMLSSMIRTSRKVFTEAF
jgi:DNA-binding CsgD family transcriptional regulator/PAS domain-containing protein